MCFFKINCLTTKSCFLTLQSKQILQDLCFYLDKNNFLIDTFFAETPRTIRESNTYRQNPGRFKEKFFILIPKSGRALPLTNDSRISREQEEDTLILKQTVNGAPRSYRLPVYSITAQNGMVSISGRDPGKTRTSVPLVCLRGTLHVFKGNYLDVLRGYKPRRI